MIIELEVEGIDLDKWADFQHIHAAKGQGKLTKAEADLKRSIAEDATRWLHRLGFPDAKVKPR